MDINDFIVKQSNKLVNGVYTFDEKVEMLIGCGLTSIEMNDTNFLVTIHRRYDDVTKKLYNVVFDLPTQTLNGIYNFSDVYVEKYSEMHPIRQHTIKSYVNEFFVLLMQKVDNEKVSAYVNLITEPFLNKLQIEKVNAVENIKKIDASLENVNNSIAELEMQLSQYKRVKEDLLDAKEDATFKNVVNETAERYAAPFDEPNSKIIKYFIIDIMKQTGWFR